jgi:antitoxin (DNA-binding transcriptional repressor) of toxin-antitoxin stability system
MLNKIISATEASRSLSELLNQVYYRGKSFHIKRGKDVVAQLVPITMRKKLKVSELNDLFKRLPSLDYKDSQAFEKTIHEMRAQLNVQERSWD